MIESSAASRDALRETIRTLRDRIAALEAALVGSTPAPECGTCGGNPYVPPTDPDCTCPDDALAHDDDCPQAARLAASKAGDECPACAEAEAAAEPPLHLPHGRHVQCLEHPDDAKPGPDEVERVARALALQYAKTSGHIDPPDYWMQIGVEAGNHTEKHRDVYRDEARAAIAALAANKEQDDG